MQTYLDFWILSFYASFFFLQSTGKLVCDRFFPDLLFTLPLLYK